MVGKISFIMMLVFLFGLNLDLRAMDSKQDEEVHEPPLKRIAVDLSCRYGRDDIIVKLDLSYNQHLTNVKFLLGFPHLTDINLCSCINLKDNYKSISSLTNLKKLNIGSIWLTELFHIRNLTNITDLDLNNNNTIEVVKDLIFLPKLKKLNLRGNLNLLDLERLHELKSLRNLCLHGIFNEPMGQSIDFLSSMTNLRTLDLSVNIIKYIKPLAKIPKLKHLFLTGCSSIKDFKNLKKLKNIVTLDLSHINYIDQDMNENLEKQLEKIRLLEHLKLLTISYKINFNPLPSDKFQLKKI